MNPPFNTPIVMAAGLGDHSPSLSSSSSRSACPVLSHRITVGVPSRTTRRSSLMSRPIDSGSRTGKTSTSRSACGSAIESLAKRRNAPSSIDGGSKSSSRSGESSPRRRATSTWCAASYQVRVTSGSM
jgi:hypothetical protein